MSVTEVSPYQFISFQLPANIKPADINATAVQLTMGTASVNAYPDSAAFANNVYLYHLMVPELPEGDQKLTLNIAEGKVAEASIKITSFTKIANAPSYIDTWQANAQKEIDDAALVYDAQVQSGNLRKSTADSLKSFLQQAFDKNKELIAALPDEEKLVFVQLLDANKAWIDEYKAVFIQNPLSNYRTTTQGDCEEYRRLQKQYWDEGSIGLAGDYQVKAEQCEAEREKQRLEATGKYSAKMKEAYEEAKAAKAATPGRIRGAWAFVSTFITEAAKGIIETATGIEDLDHPFAALDIEDTKKERIADQKFIVDKEYEFTTGIKLVNLNKQNAAQFTGFTPIIKAIDDYNSMIAGTGQFLPFTPAIKLPAAKSLNLYVSGYTIDQISDPRITIFSKDRANGKFIMVTWNSAVDHDSIDFTFRVNYTTNFGNVSKVITATVSKAEPASLTLVSGNNQNSRPNTDLPDPLVVLVKDSAGSPVQGATVNWNV
ncbi:MAG TPA: hypothetical protein VFS31_04190, partial [Chitinophagaceae bacterium]|nr:hypothetical protein [Chitinophagaceae bacterium]